MEKRNHKRCIRLRSCGKTSWLPVCSGKCGNSFRKRESHVENGGRFFRSDELDADYPGKPRICRADGRSRLFPGDRRGEQKAGKIQDPYRCQSLAQWRYHHTLPANQTACGGRTKKMFLALYRRRDGRPLLFANQNAESGRVFLGTYQSSFSSFSVPSRNP